MGIYIRSAQAISPQNTFPAYDQSDDVTEYSPLLKNILPDFKDYLNPLERRRMSTLLKSGIACAIQAVREAGIEKPDAILSGTGLGCVEDTEKFLHTILRNEAQILSPTAFVQSTHNSIGAFIALKYACHEHNMLYAHRTLSFEHALIDSLVLFSENKVSNVLVGGFDEITSENFELKKRVGIYKQDTESNLKIAESTSKGSIAGEGCAYFVLTSNKSENNIAEVLAVDTQYRTLSHEQRSDWLNSVIKRYGIVAHDIDILLSGINGDINVNKTCLELAKNTFPKSTHAFYKHMCGEYDTAASFALWYAYQILKSGSIPKHSVIDDRNRACRYILIYNHGSENEHSAILLKKVR